MIVRPFAEQLLQGQKTRTMTLRYRPQVLTSGTYPDKPEDLPGTPSVSTVSPAQSRPAHSSWELHLENAHSSVVPSSVNSYLRCPLFFPWFHSPERPSPPNSHHSRPPRRPPSPPPPSPPSPRLASVSRPVSFPLPKTKSQTWVSSRMSSSS